MRPDGHARGLVDEVARRQRADRHFGVGAARKARPDSESLVEATQGRPGPAPNAHARPDPLDAELVAEITRQEIVVPDVRGSRRIVGPRRMHVPEHDPDPGVAIESPDHLLDPVVRDLAVVVGDGEDLPPRPVDRPVVRGRRAGRLQTQQVDARVFEEREKGARQGRSPGHVRDPDVEGRRRVLQNRADGPCQGPAPLARADDHRHPWNARHRVRRQDRIRSHSSAARLARSRGFQASG